MIIENLYLAKLSVVKTNDKKLVYHYSCDPVLVIGFKKNNIPTFLLSETDKKVIPVDKMLFTDSYIDEIHSPLFVAGEMHNKYISEEGKVAETLLLVYSKSGMIHETAIKLWVGAFFRKRFFLRRKMIKFIKKTGEF